MKNSDILFIVNSYYALKNKEAEGKVKVTDLPASVAWKRRLNFKDLIKASETIHEALREVDDKFADDEHSEPKTFDGKELKVVRSEYIEEYSKAQTEILSQDTDVTIRKFKIEELEGKDLSDEMLDTLMFMIEEEDDG